ncbi:MAG: hypothetical protein ACREOS_08735, partial [Candidatus Dormibacteraceae bacterium]
ADWADDAPVYHEASSMRAGAWLVEPVRLQIMPSLIARIPELRQELFGRYFVAREHPAFYLALAGVIGVVLHRRAGWLLLTLPWLWLMHPMIDRDVARPGRWWRIPLKYALTAARQGVGAVALILASIRCRTLVV